MYKTEINVNVCQMMEKKVNRLSALLDRMCCEDAVARVSLQNIIDVSRQLPNNHLQFVLIRYRLIFNSFN